jgi:hypothetical protein
MENDEKRNICKCLIEGDNGRCELCLLYDDICVKCNNPFKYIDLMDCPKCHDSYCEKCCTFGYGSCACEKCLTLYFHASITGYKITHHGHDLCTLSKIFSLDHYPTQEEIISIVQSNLLLKLERCKVISYSKLKRKQYENFIR